MFMAKFFQRMRLFIFILAVLAATNVSAANKPAYQKAVKDAAFVTEDEISKELIPINDANMGLVWNDDKSKILVATWKAQGSYEQFLKPYDKTSDNPDYAVWVTTVPQVKDMCSALPNKREQAVNRRLKQYLGLDPDWTYDVFVEMWVSPQDIFRPCVDPEIDDNTCNLNFAKTIPTVKNIPDYQDFYEALYYKSYRGSAGVPWTGLGYTYDWGNRKSDVGASEYILVPGAAYEIKQAVPTMAYCGKP